MSDILMNDPHGQAMAAMGPLDTLLSMTEGYGRAHTEALAEVATLRRSHALLVRLGAAQRACDEQSRAVAHALRPRAGVENRDYETEEAMLATLVDERDAIQDEIHNAAQALATAPTPEQP